MRSFDKELETKRTQLIELEQKLTLQRGQLSQAEERIEGLSQTYKNLTNTIAKHDEALANQVDAKFNELDKEINERHVEVLAKMSDDVQEFREDVRQKTKVMQELEKVSKSLLDHASGNLVATNWASRAKRERAAAHTTRAIAFVILAASGLLGYFLIEASLTSSNAVSATTATATSAGQVIARLGVTSIFAALGALLYRESSRHYKEADTAEDVKMSLEAIEPYFVNAEDDERKEAHRALGKVALIESLLSRFASRDASKHTPGIDIKDLTEIAKTLPAFKNTGS